MAACPCGRVDCRENDHLLWPTEPIGYDGFGAPLYEHQIDMSSEEHIVRGTE